MSLDTVVEDIREEAQERAEEIRQEGEEAAEEIIAEAESDAEEIRESAEEEVEQKITREREQAKSSAKLEAKQDRMGARRELLEEAYAAVETELAELEEDRRRSLTEALLKAAGKEFNNGDLEVYGRADDKELLQDICEESDGYTYGGEYSCLGGVVVESASSNVRVNNTFDSILEDVWEDNLQNISNTLFEQ